MTLPGILGTAKRRRVMAVLVLLGAVQAGLMLAAAFALGGFLEVSEGTSAWPLIALLLGLGALSLVVRAIGRAEAERFGLGYVAICRVRLLKAIVRNGGEGGRHGLAMTRMITDLSSLKGWVGIGIAGGATHAAMLTVLAVGAGSLSSSILLALGLAAGLSALIALAVFRPLRRRIRQVRSRRGGLAGRVGEALLTAPTIRSFGGLDREKGHVYRLSERLSRAAAWRYFYASLLRHGPDLGFIAGFAFLGLAALQAPEAALSSLAPGLLILTAATGALRALARCLEYWLSYEEGRRRLTELLAEAGPSAEPWQSEGALAVTLDKARIGPSDKRVSLEIPAGAVVEIAAAAEATAFLRTIAGLDRAASGRIRLTDADGLVRNAARVSRAAALVAPEVPLRRGSLASNLQAGMAGGERGERVDRIAEIARLCDLWNQDLDPATALATQIPEAGRGLPASIAARIRLARAVLSEPGILILDDPIFEIDTAARLALSRVASRLSATVLISVHGSMAPISTSHRLEHRQARYRLAEIQASPDGPVPLRQVS
ncbi:MAG: hypothetical protein AAGI13_05150 [Pseudomonadota bacterium]